MIEGFGGGGNPDEMTLKEIKNMEKSTMTTPEKLREEAERMISPDHSKVKLGGEAITAEELNRVNRGKILTSALVETIIREEGELNTSVIMAAFFNLWGILYTSALEQNQRNFFLYLARLSYQALAILGSVLATKEFVDVISGESEKAKSKRH